MDIWRKNSKQSRGTIGDGTFLKDSLLHDVDLLWDGLFAKRSSQSSSGFVSRQVGRAEVAVFPITVV
jgi:hypothetical protein